MRSRDHDADDRPHQVELARRVHARHLGRLAAEQRHAGVAARVGDAVHDGGDVRSARAALAT
jgi:hypothetical protein